jgi:predicted AlkP superfamily phosphohydrolase/phosphomutase
MTRVAAIGLDAAEWTMIDGLIEEGRLPHLAELRSRGSECILETGTAYRSELPWTQFLTGVDARTTGYWSTAAFDPSDYSARLIGAYNGQPFFARDDLSVICLDVPHTTIHPDVNGVQVTAWGAHSPQYPRASRPAGTLAEIDRRFGTNPSMANDYDGTWYQPKFMDAIGEALITGAHRRVEIAEWLLDQNPGWELFLTVLTETHSIGHLCWHAMDPDHPLHGTKAAASARSWFIRVYEEIDDAVGRLLRAVGPDTATIVFANHGMQSNGQDLPSQVLLPELIHRRTFGEGLLLDIDQDSWRRAGCPPLRPPERLKWLSAVRKQFATTADERRRKQLRMRLPDWPVEYARRIQNQLTGRPRMTWQFDTDYPPESIDSVEEMNRIVKSVDWQPPMYYRAYWPRMEWFVLPTFSDAHVRINVAGRERDGLVPIDDFHDTIDRFTEFVHQCRNPRTGNPAVKAVQRMRDHPLEENAPDGDLIVEWTEPADALEHPDVGMVGPIPFGRTGEHSVNGFALMAGPGIERSDLGRRSAFDLPPTVLSLLGKPPDRDLAGSPLLGNNRAL